jgi:iron complex transport system substrate-binding protein
VSLQRRSEPAADASSVRPMRICSLLPSATEVVCAVGLRDSLVAVSHECDFPAAVRALPKITRSNIPKGLASSEIDQFVSAALADAGSLYALNVELLEKLAPDLIITQQLCDVCAVATDYLEDVLAGLGRKPAVVSLNAQSLQGILDDIQTAATALGRSKEGARVVAKLRRRIEAVEKKTRNLAYRPRVCCLEWVDPPYCGGHWMNELVEIAGGRDELAVRHRPSYRIEWGAIGAFAPEIIVLTCCGYDLERCAQEARLLAQRKELQDVPALRTGAVFATDSSSYFARPGPRIVESLEILASIVHPELFSAPDLPNAFCRATVREGAGALA